jgi:putative MATE family efflux protein
VTAAPTHDRSLVDEPLPRLVRRFALPAAASNLLMTLFGSVDAFWVGTRVGAAGLAAVSTSVFWVWLIVSLAEMVSIGLTAVAARRHGERRPEEAARIAGEAIGFSLLLGTAVAIVGHLLLPLLFDVMHTPPEVTALGVRYLGAYLLAAPLFFGYFAADATFRAAGDTRTPFVLLLTSVVVTLVLDPVLILGLGPFPALGITGAAVATVGVRSVAFVIGLAILARRGLARVRLPSPATAAAIARIGLPPALTGVLFSLIYVALTRTTTRFGTPALAALGLGHRVESWLYMIGVGFGAAAAAIVGQNLGAGERERAARAGWVITGYATLPALLGAALSLAFPREVAALFTPDAAVIAEAARYLRIVAVAQLFVCAELVLESAMGGAGDTVPPMLTSTPLTLARVPLAAWAAARWGAPGLWWVLSLTAVGRGVAMMALWRLGRWQRKSV